MDDGKDGFDFKRFLDSLQPPKRTEAEERAKLIEYRRIRVDQWRDRVRSNLPIWPFARWNNHDWVQRCDPRIVSFLRDLWEPFSRDGKDWKPGGSVLVCAPPKHGKSTGIYAALRVAVSGVRKALEAGEDIGQLPSIMWTTEAALVDEQRAYRTELLERCSQSSILVIDELGLAGGHQAPVGGTPVIMQLLGMRHDQGLSTCVTSGVGRVALESRYGGGAYRRMTERGRALDIVGRSKPS